MPRTRARTTTLAPRLDFTGPHTDADADARLLGAHDDRDGERFAQADLTDFDLTGSSFAECEFTAVTFTSAQLRAARFTETLMTTPYAPVLLAARTTWRDVMIDRPRWGSVEMFDADLTAVHIRGGKIDYLNLRNARLSDILIEDCLLTELDLSGTRNLRVSLRNCRIGTLDLTQATSTHLDLRTSELSALNGLEGLKGATIDDGQLAQLAPVFATHFGLFVE